MEIDRKSFNFLKAMRDFRRARQRAVLENIASHLTGKSADLLSYNEIRDQLKGGDPVSRGLQEIPLDAIVGSVGRYTDFTRSFLPRSKSSSERWAEVKAAIERMGEIPPITVFQIGQVYFVLDGNHRVSIARQQGKTHIPAYVTEIQTDVPLSPDVQPDDLICSARYAGFLQKTGLHKLRPQADLKVTAPGQYRLLEEQIDIHRHWLSQKENRAVPYREAVEHWYDEVYLPVVQIIRERGILRHFPHRTETDLYVWIFEHQEELKEMLGWEVDPESVANDLVTQFSPNPHHLVERVKERILHAIIPDPLEAGPPPGQWRKEQLPAHHQKHLFGDILCLVSEKEKQVAWQALEQALVVAQREEGRVHGLHVVNKGGGKEVDASLKSEFEERCRASNIPGELSIESGNLTRKLCRRARWADLVVVSLPHPPEPQPLARLSSGFGTLIRSCPRPVLAVPARPSPLKRALLAYDGSPKAKEALFVAAYLCAKWKISLVVVTVLEKGHITSDTLASAKKYLEARGVEPTYVQEQGTIAWAIIRTAQLYESDFIIMGGYGFNPVMEVFMGSEVDQILRARQWPVLICR